MLVRERGTAASKNFFFGGLGLLGEMESRHTFFHEEVMRDDHGVNLIRRWAG